MIDTINKRKLLKNLMAYDFMLTELGLYLNSHPDDNRALKMHNEMSEKSSELQKKYVKEYGPLVSKENSNTEKWEWIKGPWPWENQ